MLFLIDLIKTRLFTHLVVLCTFIIIHSSQHANLAFIKKKTT